MKIIRVLFQNVEILCRFVKCESCSHFFVVLSEADQRAPQTQIQKKYKYKYKYKYTNTPEIFAGL